MTFPGSVSFIWHISWARYLANFRGRDKNDSATDLALGRLYINMCLGISRKQFLSNLFVGLSCVICIPLIKHLSSLRENDIHVISFFSPQRAQKSVLNTVASQFCLLLSTKF